MNDFRIVAATKKDTGTMERLARAIWPVAYGDIIGTDQMEYMLDLMYSEPELIKQFDDGVDFALLLAPVELEADSIVSPTYARGKSIRYTAVGYLGYQFDYLPETTKIHKIYLLPATQGKGYGKALIKYAERKARGKGQSKLRLDVNYQNKALGFYEHLGFKKLGRFDTHIGRGYLMEDWQMEKEL